jgi:uncharacterized membrane protein YhaH (DUF805 family)
MDMKEAFVTCMKKYATFSGRATRSEYWWFILCEVLIIVGVSAISDRLGGLAGLLLLLPVLAAGARRLHDIGRSAWWLLIGFIPVIGTLLLIYWAVQPSQPGANEFGEPASGLNAV